MAGCIGDVPTHAIGGDQLLSARAAAALARLGPTTTDAVVSRVVYVVLGSITIALPSPTARWVASARGGLDSTKEWLAVHNAAVMTVPLAIVGVTLIAECIPVLHGFSC